MLEDVACDGDDARRSRCGWVGEGVEVELEPDFQDVEGSYAESDDVVMSTCGMVS